MTNTPLETTCVVSLHTPEIVKEFIVNEAAFDKVAVYEEFSNKAGFFFENGPRAFHLKGIFAKVFRPEGLEKLTPALCRLLKTGFERFNKKHQISNTDFVRVDLDDLFKPIMFGVTSTLIFGDETKSRYWQASSPSAKR